MAYSMQRDKQHNRSGDSDRSILRTALLRIPTMCSYASFCSSCLIVDFSGQEMPRPGNQATDEAFHRQNDEISQHARHGYEAREHRKT